MYHIFLLLSLFYIYKEKHLSTKNKKNNSLKSYLLNKLQWLYYFFLEI